ncbi:PREDICTED: cytochrome c oxidase subunit 7B2, mitochondrial [Dipodomys ordii]|uniref:Cytochrome c oxidase subunit 7B, mitochondrial n=1 Tax=Dipodomys ordii TaxID=10020 RepID=A0A1S3EK88_DIPOR|nr:PREDICTED: cytochrome c oxidase subunit 7B2, mitochondrial [Dipodomys ordii]
MFRLGRSTLSNLNIRSIQEMMARSSHLKHSPDFHDKYGNAVLASGISFCIVSWFVYITQIGVEWNLSPVGRVIPKTWKHH